MDPENVNPSKFKVEHVLFDNPYFAIAYGIWENDSNRLAMRWNGTGENAGYPKAFGHPMWFIVDEQLYVPILRSLIGYPNADSTKILKVLEQII